MLFTGDERKFLEFFKKADRMGALVGAKILSVNAQECRFSYTVRPEHYNPNGILHGGALYTVMDSSQGAFVHFWLEEEFQGAATGTATIRYEAPLKEGEIQIRTWLKGREKRKIFVSSEAKDSSGRLVATLEEIWIAIPKV